jgi:ribosomal protein S18 acetylase RimI-like enzyme
MMIRKYISNDEAALFRLMEDEGIEWQDYYGDSGRRPYGEALRNDLVYVAMDESRLCGYIRCKEDNGFGIYVYDLLVGKPFRGREVGKQLIQQIEKDHPLQAIYVMSDADPYYRKLGYERIGSIFQVKHQSEK